MSARREARKGGTALRPYPGDALLALLSALLLVLSFAHSVDAGPGDLDATFGTGGRVLTDFGGGAEAGAVVLQADGKIVVAGGFGGAFFALARYNADGTLDPSFGSEGRVFTNFGGRDGARALALQADGKIVATGFTSSDFGTRRRFALARYNPDGSLDRQVVTSFADRDEASALALQSAGKIVGAGVSGA